MAGVRNQDPVILVVADYLSLSDLKEADHPNIRHLLSHGALGLISPSAQGKKNPSAVYATLGAGAYLRGTEAVDEAYNFDEKVPSEKDTAADVFARRMGEPAPGSGVVNLGISSLVRANEKSKRAQLIGQMGSSFRKAGKKVAVFGNSDIGEWLRRPAAAIAMDEFGRVPYGDVSARTLKQEPASATGWVTDVDRLAEAVISAAEESDLIVMEFGDTSRLYGSQHELTARAFARYHAESMDRLDILIGEMVSFADTSGSRILVASFVPPGKPGEKWDELTPIIAYGKGFGRGLIVSSTTRRPGLVAGVDLAPTLLELTGVSVPQTMVGRVMKYKNHPKPLTDLDYLDKITRTNVILQWPVLGAAAIIGGALVTLAAVAVAFRRRLRPAANAALRMGLVLAYSLLGGLLFSGLGDASVYAAVRNVLLGTVLLFAAGHTTALVLSRFTAPGSLGNLALPMLGVYLITAAIVAFDGLTGARLIGSCIASYQLIPGFRFYGIGNEYMGVLIGSLFTAVLWMSVSSRVKELTRVRQTVILTVFALTAFILGWPGYGANAGGAVAAVVAFGLGYRAVSRGIFRMREALIFTAVSIAILAGIAFMDMAMNHSSSSHMGLTAGVLARDSLASVFQLISRKVVMNLTLIATKQSRAAIIGFTPFLAMWFFLISPRVRTLSETYQRLWAGLAAGMAGAAAAFIFNDSGIISASIIVASVVCCLLYSLLQEEANVAADNGS